MNPADQAGDTTPLIIEVAIPLYETMEQLGKLILAELDMELSVEQVAAYMICRSGEEPHMFQAWLKQEVHKQLHHHELCGCGNNPR